MPRLIYADWMEEQGLIERARFIRLQVELAQLPKDDPREPALKSQCNLLLQKHREEWFGLIRRFVASIGEYSADREFPEHRCKIRRGFLDGIELSLNEFLQYGTELYARWPLYQVKLDNASPMRVKELTACPWLANVRHLTVYRANHTQPEMELLGDSPFVTQLRVLNLGENHIGSKGAAVLAKSPNLANLEDLDIRHNSVGQDGIWAVARSPYLKKLQKLDLCGNREHNVRDIAYLLQSTALPELSGLSLWYTNLGDEGVAQLAALPALGRLTWLNLNNNQVTEKGVRALARSRFVRNLRTLLLAYNRIPPEAVQLLLDSDNLANVSLFNLHKNESVERQSVDFCERYGSRLSLDQPV
jgi:hypothetical protein